ncbi:uncharacterized protein LOC142616572 [Castanea sativa]|uniref:uncharacterized protein LOC142616572 n=1 Tax=Castanea sativa TaxID=21020 RepID=UPI003F64F06D
MVEMFKEDKIALAVANVVSPHLPPDLNATWVPPMGSFYMLNVDGTVFSSQKEAAVWVIIRDDKGLVVAALSKKIPDPLGALEVEAKAFKASIQLAKDVGIHELVLEGDSIIVYRALTSISPSPTSVAPIIYGIGATFHDFRIVVFSHVCR